MGYRISSLEISDTQPFKNDKLDREELVGFVSGIVKQADGEPLVLALDGPYGSGKSTFVLMLQAVLNSQNYQTVYFDAWKADHVSGPLIALVASLDASLPKKDAGRLQAGISRVKRVASVLGKRAIVASVKIGTAGIVDLPTDIEKIFVDAAGEGAKDLVDLYQAETKLIASFREELENVVQRLGESQKNPALVFFIDELDRCRPDFAISLLERIKHMFDVPNIVFVLSVDKRQLEGAASAVYGRTLNAAEYLRKFIDIEFSLPRLPSKEFIASVMDRAKIDPLFAKRIDGPPTDKYDFARLFLMLADVFELGLRAQERCILRLKLVLLQTGTHEPFLPFQTALLIVIRLVDSDIFWGIVTKKLSAIEIERFINRNDRAARYFGTAEWNILLGLLIAENVDAVARRSAISEFEHEIQAGQMSWPTNTKFGVINNMQVLGLQPGGGYALLGKKIDLASRTG